MKKTYTQVEVSLKVNEAINKLQALIWRQDSLFKDGERKEITIKIEDILIWVRDALDNCRVIDSYPDVINPYYDIPTVKEKLTRATR